MYKHFELWLDESGDFLNEALKSVDPNKNSSLVGGILVPKEKVNEIVNDVLIPTNLWHAMELTKGQKRNHVLPTLERLKNDYGATEVFFENQQYEDGTGQNKSRSLYLRIISEGLLQLMLTLNAIYEDVRLDVLIARRSTGMVGIGLMPITNNEYINRINECMKSKKKNHRIVLSEESSFSFSIKGAEDDKRLQFADYACNTRLIRNSSIYNTDTFRPRVEALHKEALIFTMTEIDSINYIKQCLVENDISEAVYELMTTPDEIDFHEVMGLIMDKIDGISYRIIKSQMRNISATLIAHADRQDRYEDEENFLKKILNQLVPEFESKKLPCGHLKFNAQLLLSDIYLVEGDIINARESVNNLEKAQAELGNCMEELFTLFQLKEKQSQLATYEFDYEKGIRIMKDACDVFEHMMKSVSGLDALSDRFPEEASEYYGDALCMELHAMMLMQREKPSIYDEACRLSDIALKQYPRINGELERHRQYRSHIEMEAGNYEEALKILALAREYKLESLNASAIAGFLRDVSTNEVESSIQYYTRYYLSIMCEAKRAGNALADEMYNALVEEKNVLSILGITDDTDRSYTNRINVSDILNTTDHRTYHPMEIVHWKLGDYYMMCGKCDDGRSSIISSTSLCFKHKEYTRMYIMGLCIMADLIICIMENGSKGQLGMHVKTLTDNLQFVLDQDLSSVTRDFVLKIKDMYTEAGVYGNNLAAIDKDKLVNISRLITY